jgi:hypothetical protein
MADLVSLPSPTGDGAGYVSLASTPQGRLIRKQILKIGKPFVHPRDPNTKIVITHAMAAALKRNFDRGMSMVQVPIVNDANQHTEDPTRNAGEVIDVEVDDNAVYVTIDARKHADDFGKTILGASAMLHLNYRDTETGEQVGPTLLHVAATNRPHINGLKGYEDAIKASAAADITGDETVAFLFDEEVALSHETKDGPMTLDELKAAAQEHGIDIEALQAAATKAAELSGQLDAVNEKLALSGGDVSVTDLAEALVELSASNKSQAQRIEALEADKQTLALSAAESEIDGYIKAGRILPKQRDAMVKLSMSDRETFTALLPEQAVVSLSESGVGIHEERETDETTKANLARYGDMAAKLSTKRR